MKRRTLERLERPFGFCYERPVAALLIGAVASISAAVLYGILGLGLAALLSRAIGQAEWDGDDRRPRLAAA